jgi:hypothetical protein
VHRSRHSYNDLKPGQLVVDWDERDESMVVSLVDFGGGERARLSLFWGVVQHFWGQRKADPDDAPQLAT